MSTVELILAALALAVYLAYLDHAAAARPARRRVDSELSERRQWERVERRRERLRRWRRPEAPSWQRLIARCCTRGRVEYWTAQAAGGLILVFAGAMAASTVVGFVSAMTR
jgi:hypothetical protein